MLLLLILLFAIVTFVVASRVVLESDLDLTVNRQGWRSLSMNDPTLEIPSITVQIWMKWHDFDKIEVIFFSCRV
jgi:hypothetical protein